MGCVDSRCVYARVTEVGVYIYLGKARKGTGLVLLEELFAFKRSARYKDVNGRYIS